MNDDFAKYVKQTIDEAEISKYKARVRYQTMMESKLPIIPAGNIIVVSSDESNDCYELGIFRVINDIEPSLLRNIWLYNHPDQEAEGKFMEYDFLIWVIELGLLERIILSHDWHLCDYRDVAKMSVD